MTRIEHIGDATLYLGDCREIAPTLSVDAVISDPPYGIGYVRGQKLKTGVYRGGKKVGEAKGGAQNKFAGVPIVGDDCPFDPSMPSMLLRFGDVLIWGADHYRMALPDTGRWLAWDKLAGKPSWDSFADVEFAWHSRGGASRVFSYLWKGLACDKREFGNGIATRDHPTQKPIALMVWCIQQAGMPERILDPYLGSGTTGVAALRLGRKFIGIEIEERWFDVACRRIEAEAKQGRLLIDEISPRSPAPALELPLEGGS